MVCGNESVVTFRVACRVETRATERLSWHGFPTRADDAALTRPGCLSGSAELRAHVIHPVADLAARDDADAGVEEQRALPERDAVGLSRGEFLRAAEADAAQRQVLHGNAVRRLGGRIAAGRLEDGGGDVLLARAAAPLDRGLLSGRRLLLRQRRRGRRRGEDGRRVDGAAVVPVRLVRGGRRRRQHVRRLGGLGFFRGHYGSYRRGGWGTFDGEAAGGSYSRPTGAV